MIKWYGEKLCDQGFIINLEERKDRYDRVRKNLRIGKFTGLKRFNAVKIIEPNFTKYGCTQSHIEIAKKQIKNNWEYVLYMEDDSVINFFYDYSINESEIDKEKVAKNIIKELNEKKPDVLWLGVRPEEDTEYVSNFLVKPKKTLMSHAYIGSIKYAKFLVDNLKYKDNNHFSAGYPIDFFLSQINTKDCWRLENFDNEKIMKNNDLKIYMTVPMIFNQGESFSNLTDNYVDYKIWVTGCYQAYANINKLNIKPLLNE